MAKKSNSVVFSNAQIDLDADQICEIKKDEMIMSSLSALLKEWDGVPGITISIKHEQGYQPQAEASED